MRGDFPILPQLDWEMHIRKCVTSFINVAHFFVLF